MPLPELSTSQVSQPLHRSCAGHHHSRSPAGMQRIHTAPEPCWKGSGMCEVSLMGTWTHSHRWRRSDARGIWITVHCYLQQPRQGSTNWWNVVHGAHRGILFSHEKGSYHGWAWRSENPKNAHLGFASYLLKVCSLWFQIFFKHDIFHKEKMHKKKALCPTLYQWNFLESYFWNN